MKNLGIVYLFFSLVFFAAFPCGAQDCLVFSNPEYVLEVQGLLPERILKEAYSRIGIKFEFIKIPSELSIVMANDGITDGIFMRIAGLEQKYPNLVIVPFPIQYLDIVVFTKDTDFTVTNWLSLSPYTIGFVKGFKMAEANTKGMHVETTKTIDQAFLMLNVGRIDIVIATRTVQCRLKDLDVSGIRILEPPIIRIPLYHYLNKRHIDLVDEILKVLSDMETSGELDSIREQALEEFNEICGQ